MRILLPAAILHAILKAISDADAFYDAVDTRKVRIRKVQGDLAEKTSMETKNRPVLAAREKGIS